MSVAIHCNPGIEWQAKRGDYFSAGLKALGIDHSITSSRTRVADTAILFGTTYWRDIEADGKYLLVDRASFGDPEYVQLVWSGHGRRGDHMVPKGKGGRAALIAPETHPWRIGSQVVLCGQAETYSPHYSSLSEWYGEINATHFRKHPVADNPTELPIAKDWSDCHLAITLNSSIGVDAVINGVSTVTMDEASMVWDVTSHDQHFPQYRDRRPWLDWLCWTQWSWDEIRAGKPIRHLFEEL